MIITRNLTKCFGDFVAVNGVSLEVRVGEVLALLGPNGAGKTTTVRMLTAILKPSGGGAQVAGYDVVTAADQVRRHVGVLTEQHGLYLRMVGEEYLDFFGEVYGLTPAQRRARARALLERFGMATAARQRLGEYSKGMRQKLALIRALLHDPPVLLLDEPTSAMDPQAARLVRDAIAELRAEGRTILLCTHNLTEAEQLADKIAIIHRGRIVAQGTPGALKRDFLGPPLLEVCCATPIDGAVAILADIVEVVAMGPNWLRYRTPEPEKINPVVCQRLSAHHIPLVTLTAMPQSMEEVYLRVVGGEVEK